MLLQRIPNQDRAAESPLQRLPTSGIDPLQAFANGGYVAPAVVPVRIMLNINCSLDLTDARCRTPPSPSEAFLRLNSLCRRGV